MVSPLEGVEEEEEEVEERKGGHETAKKKRREQIRGKPRESTQRREESEALCDGWMDVGVERGVRSSEEERYCLVAGDAAASSDRAKWLTTARQQRLEKRKQRDRDRDRGRGRGRAEELSHIHLLLTSMAPGSCWKMKNYMALIRLHYRTCDYMCLTPVQKIGDGEDGGTETFMI